MMGLDLYQRYWRDETVTAALIVLKPGEDVDANVRALRTALTGLQGVRVQPNQALRLKRWPCSIARSPSPARYSFSPWAWRSSAC